VDQPTMPDQPSAAMRGKLAVIASAREEVVIVNPYILPGPIGLKLMAEAARQGTRVLIVTNSLDSTDEPLVHRAYSRYRAAMLKLGMKLYEFSPELARKSGTFGDYQHATLRLHAKVAVVDRRWSGVGIVQSGRALGPAQHRAGRHHRLPGAGPAGLGPDQRRWLRQHVPPGHGARPGAADLAGPGP